LAIAFLISIFLVSSNLLLDILKSMLFILLAPDATAASIQLDILTKVELSICIELVTVNSVIFSIVPDSV
jgi:hypothetical protein